MKTKLILIAIVLLVGVVILGAGGATAVAQADAFAEVPPVNQLIVKYTVEANLNAAEAAQATAQMQQISEAAGVALTYFRPMAGEAHVVSLPGWTSVDEAEQMSARLAALPEVEYAEPNYIMFAIEDMPEAPLLVPNDTYYGLQWHYAAPTSGNYGVNAPTAWDMTTGSSSVYVAVLDTGILDHADLSGRWTGGYDMISDSFMANDGDGRDSDPHDPGDWITTNECGFPHNAQSSSWHGTHVAGTIGAATNNSAGVAGLNWVSQVIPVRVLGKCGGTVADIADGIYWAAGLAVPGAPANAHPAQVINMSLGGPGSCVSTYQNAIDAAYGAGTAVVVAAGNDGIDASGFRPANCNNVIAVASTDRPGNRASYSNYGSVVEISAPGGDTSTGSGGENGVLSTLNDGSTVPGSDVYAYYQGTSMAAPHVAGIASLMYSIDPTLTPAEILSYMQSSVTAFPGGSTCNTSICGSGIINAAAALDAIPGVVPVAPTLDAISNPDGDGNYTVNWNDIADATSYTLQEDDNPAFSSPATAYTGAISQYAVSGQTGGTWYYRVRASNADGDSPWSNTVSVIVVPDAPTLNAIVNPGDDDAYTVDWSASTGADGYELEEANNPGFTGATTRYMGVNTQYDVTGQAGGTWYYRVNAYIAGDASVWSNVVSTTVVASYLNAPILSPIDNADGDGEYPVQWASVVSATSYILEESSNEYFINPSVAYSGVMTSTNITGKTGGTWYYRVRASDGTENSPWSNSESVELPSFIFLPLLQKDFGFDSEFTANVNGWVTHAGTWVLNGGYYRTVGVPAYGSSISFTRDYTQFSYQTRLYRSGCQDCSNRLFVHGTPEPLGSGGRWNKQYLFQYTASGYISVYLIIGNDDPIALIEWTESSAINTGNAWNEVAVEVVDGYIYFYINGSLVASGPVDSSLTSGRVGIGMYRSQDSVGDEFYVDWAVLTEIVSATSSTAEAMLTWSSYAPENLGATDSNMDYFIP